MARRKKKWEKGEGKYYFNVKSGNQVITIFRKTKKAALHAYEQYRDVGKQCEWLGRWDGDEFKEVNLPASVAA